MKLRQLLPSSLAGIVLLLAHLLPPPQDGNLAGLPTLCPLKNLTSLPCPGCGITRSMVLFAHGDWAQAISFHPLGPVVYLLFWMAFIFGLRSIKQKEQRIPSRFLIYTGGTLSAALLIVWVVRLTGIIPFPAHF